MKTLPVFRVRALSCRAVIGMTFLFGLVPVTSLGIVSPSFVSLALPPSIDQARDSWFGWTDNHDLHYRLVLDEGNHGELAVHRQDEAPSVFYIRWGLRNRSLIIELFDRRGWLGDYEHRVTIWARFDGERIYLTHYEMSRTYGSYALRGKLGVWLLREGTLQDELDLLQSKMFPRDTSSEAQRLRDLLHARYGSHWLVKWDPQKGSYERVEGLIPHLVGSTCNENAMAYKEILSLMNVDMLQFSLQPYVDNGGGDCRAEQQYEGVPVEGGSLSIDRRPDRRPGKDLIMISATIYDVHMHSTTPLVLEVEAIEIARKQMLAKDLVPKNAWRTLSDYREVAVLPKLFIFPIVDAECIDSCAFDFRLVWAIEFEADFDMTDPRHPIGFSLEGFHYLVDAHTGTVPLSYHGPNAIPPPVP